MNHPHYALSPVAGEEVLMLMDERPGFSLGKPTEERRFARILRGFRSEPSVFAVPNKGTGFTVGENAADFSLERLGVERLMALIQAGPALRRDMEAYVADEWALKPSPAARAPSRPVPPGG